MSFFQDGLEPTSLRVWLEFEAETERFDRTLPGVWDDREHGRRTWRPFDTVLSVRHAAEQRCRTEARLKEQGIPREVYERTRRFATERTHEEVIELLGRMR